ncbi:unnamed protein product [Sphenostylis stenocarpa]|uniref:Uncharacterized protein n=1 Tax=Sphenostylis stenocarpa TaxID=92480 RepID=A0AA86VZ01_9FABA|nr:unnamed protein product [Sphenostylis stenocarpa]
MVVGGMLHWVLLLKQPHKERESRDCVVASNQLSEIVTENQRQAVIILAKGTLSEVEGWECNGVDKSCKPGMDDVGATLEKTEIDY